MGRLTGLGAFLLITGGVLLVLRAVHVVVPAFFPETRPGPFVLASLEEVPRRAGFVPLVPAYRPATLGERPASLTVTLRPHPTFVIEWRGEHYLSLTERRGGPAPARSPAGRDLAGVPGATWWQQGTRYHMVLRRGELWVEVVTDLPSRDLRRIADTLGPP